MFPAKLFLCTTFSRKSIALMFMFDPLPPTYLSIYLPTYLPFYLFAYLSTCYLSFYLHSSYLSIFLPMYLSTYYLSIFLPTTLYLSFYLLPCIYLSTYYLSIFLPTSYLYINLSTYLSFYLRNDRPTYICSVKTTFCSKTASSSPKINLVWLEYMLTEIRSTFTATSSVENFFK